MQHTDVYFNIWKNWSYTVKWIHPSDDTLFAIGDVDRSGSNKILKF